MVDPPSDFPALGARDFLRDAFKGLGGAPPAFRHLARSLLRNPLLNVCASHLNEACGSTSVEWISTCLRLCRCSDLEAASLTAISLQLHDGYFPTLARDLAITAKTPQDSDSRLAMRSLTQCDDDLCRSVGQRSGECVMKMSFKLLTAAALAVGTAALAAPALAASIPSHNPRYGYDYAPSYVSYVPGPGYFAWQSGYSAPAAITSRDAPVTRHRDWR